MYPTVFRYLDDHGISLSGVLRLSDCTPAKMYLLERDGFDLSAPESIRALIFAVPYLTRVSDEPSRNLSAYAVSRDYHLFLRELFADWLPRLRAEFPDRLFAGYVDHSPIGEVDAACRAGLGDIGMNHLLLTRAYSSYVFLGELITTLDLPLTEAPRERTPLCTRCGACMRACPAHNKEAGNADCRSALTQKKGTLTDAERDILTAFPLVWGCDICQEVCPCTIAARRAGTIYTDIPFFSENAISHLTSEALDAMDDAEFSTRAFAWRGRQTIRRNLLFKETAEKTAKETAKEEQAPCSI